MQGLSEGQLLLALLGVAVILFVARAFGELARRLHQPEVLGELFAGVALGPSVLGALAPDVHRTLFLDPGASLVLSAFSWIGAILLLLAAGMEVDLGIVRSEARPGLLAATGAIVPPLVAGALFAWLVLDSPLPNSVFLGIVLAVTAVSVVAKILIEREALRRSYAQVMLAAGVAGEVVVWLLVAVVSATQGPNPLASAATSAAFAIGFFAFMAIVGRRFTHWALRRVADATGIVKGPVSLVLVLTFLSAALTQALHLHALLGAFVFGVLLHRAPRANRPLLDSVHTLTTGLFAPIFFALAGMRVDVAKLGTAHAWASVGLLFLVATAVKIPAAMLGARLGGLPTVEAALVGVGLNVKGGTDVIVAIIGVSLGVLSAEVYTMYTLVAILTVLVSPAVLGALAKRAPPSTTEAERLEREEAERRSFVPHLERVLVPIARDARPALVTEIVESIASSKERLGESFDVTELFATRDEPDEAAAAMDELASEMRDHANVEVRRRKADQKKPLSAILTAARDHDLVAIDARPPVRGRSFTFGRIQDAIIQRAETDVLVVVSEADTLDRPRRPRILVPVIGLEYSFAASDLAAHLALAWGADVVLFAVHSGAGQMSWRDRDHARLRAAASGIVEEAAFRTKRLGVPIVQRVRVGDRPSDELIRELSREHYDLVVVGCYDHGTGGRVYLGATVEHLVARASIPVVLFVARNAPRGPAR